MGAGKNFEQEPSWIIVLMLLVFLVISIGTEHLFHYFEHKFHNKEGYKEVVHKIKDELMLMGFISLILVVTQDQLTTACISGNLRVGVPEEFCRPPGLSSSSGAGNSSSSSSGSARMLLSSGGQRDLGAAAPTGCPAGQVSLMDAASIHHVHILIFVIACMHITYSIILIQMSEGMIRKWTQWERWGDDEGETLDRLTRPRAYSNKGHACCLNLMGQFWMPVSPFKYLALRRFYVSKNNLQPTFNFAAHLVEGLEQDFHELVGISYWM